MKKISIDMPSSLQAAIEHAAQNKQGVEAAAVADVAGNETSAQSAPAPAPSPITVATVKRPSTSIPSFTFAPTPELFAAMGFIEQQEASVTEVRGWQETLTKKRADAVNGVKIATGLSYGTMDEAIANVTKAKSEVEKIDAQLSAVEAIAHERAAKVAEAKQNAASIEQRVRVNQLVNAITAYNTRTEEFAKFVWETVYANWFATPPTYRSRELVPGGETLADFEQQLADLFEVYENLSSSAKSAGIRQTFNPPAIPNLQQLTYWGILDGKLTK